MATRLDISFLELSDIQRKAVNWGDGAVLVLAGPGSGKTRVLTCRAARLLERSQDDRFRILALTFTNKAANEMANRLAIMSPGLEDRAEVHTFHGFCVQVLRQHGAHLGIKPDFAIYARTPDRQGVLDDALGRNFESSDSSARRFLPMIDTLKARLVGPEQSEAWLSETNGWPPDEARRLAEAYALYEKELRRTNALDFNSLIFEAHRLFKFPAIARHYQTVYRYWLVDEFQDTNGAQYELLRRMAGKEFRQIFAVADDDQTIYEWNGANIRRIGTFVDEFKCGVIQLPTNFRCPAPIVEAANRLVVYNAMRTKGKRPAEPAKPRIPGDSQPIRCRVFNTDQDEAQGISAEIAGVNAADRERTLVLARTRALLVPTYRALQANGIPAAILSRRDDFASPQMRWLIACLNQINRPLDRRNFASLVESFNRFALLSEEFLANGIAPLEFDELLSRAEIESVAYFSVWAKAAQAAGLPNPAAEIVNLIAGLSRGELNLAETVRRIVDSFRINNTDDDLREDLSAWHRLTGEIRAVKGLSSLDRFLQELELRSKEPTPAPGAVSLATIHGAKGLEFDSVYLIGLAEDILPSWHSVKKGSTSAALEEERRSCFVAITRTKKRLILSRAKAYRGWGKQPSRFLAEMSLGEFGCAST